MTAAPEPGAQDLPVALAKLIDAVGHVFGGTVLRFQAAETDGFCDGIQGRSRTRSPEHIAGLREAAAAMRNFADSIDPLPDGLVDDDGRLRAAIRAAGLAVVELPEPDEGGQIPTWRDGSGNRWTAWNEGVEDEFDCLIEDLGRLRRTAVVILAACAASERMAAEHQGGEPQ